MTLPSILGLIVELLDAAVVPYMVTGSVASSTHGVPRATLDLDVVINPDAIGIDRLVDGLRAAALYVDRGAAREALRDLGQFNAIDATTGWKVDFLLRKDRPFSRAEFERRKQLDLLGTSTWIASPEDMIIVKLEWAAAIDSERQLRDVAAMVDVGEGTLDTAYIDRWVAELGLTEAWSRVRGEAAGT